jgi:predicted dinucleotide-binding enzyme
MNKKIGILGSGLFGQTLAEGFLKHRYDVMLGTEDANNLKEWHSRNSTAKISSFEDTINFAKILVLAIKGDPAISLIQTLATLLTNKTVIDTTNPITKIPPVNGVVKLSSSLDYSWMERLQVLAPKANFVKAFNYVGNHLMVNPAFPDGPPTMFICGNSDSAKNSVSEILELFGWEAVDLGKVEAARAIEPLCMLWLLPGFLNNRWNHAFKLIRSSK